MDLFTSRDFKVFNIPGFQERMDAIRKTIRPKLLSIGEALAPAVSRGVDRPVFVHVAKHARRTVNPPDDTWAAFGCDPRGYKKDVHFKVAVSRHCVRLLFEAGPEYYDKAGFTRAWSRERGGMIRNLKGLSWFKDEHDEEPAEEIRGRTDIGELIGRLTRRRDGQFVVGRRIGAGEFAKMDSRTFQQVAAATFGALSPLFNLHEPRKKQE